MSKHFEDWEFECHGQNCCGHSRPIESRLIEGLEQLRAMLNERHTETEVCLRISSGFRCRKYNDEIGGAGDSYHCRGMASDVVPLGATIGEVALVAGMVEVFRVGGIGLYDDFVHLDVRRNGPARW